MRTESSYSAFNARWLDPEEVARSFVPTGHYANLVRLQHSLLMGPRGCGKTTLLKMLTRRAQQVWMEEKVNGADHNVAITFPQFEAIYIPSDVRWSAELDAVTREVGLSAIDAERTQRALVALSGLIEATRVFQDLLDEKDLDPTILLKTLVSHFGLGRTVPTFAEVRLRLQFWAERVNSLLVRRDIIGLVSLIDSLHPSFTGHALDTLIRACSVFSEYFPACKPARWAFCFDELEIAPTWLKTEMFTSLRSTDQRFLLKLTWSPLLPTSLIGRQERQHDYAAIRMWHGHVLEARPFCREFSERYLRARLKLDALTPFEVFGPSPFAQENEYVNAPYESGSLAWSTMVDLAKRDPSFAEYLRNHSLDPTDPRAPDVSVRDETLRKIKPIVLIRDAFIKSSGGERRSRKNPSIYFGEDAIYAMSEGNPRLLASLLNDLLDAAVIGLDGRPRVRPEVQSRILTAASHRVLSGIRAYPVRSLAGNRSLFQLLERLGDFVHSELVTKDFNADPLGSFIVGEDTPHDLLEQLETGLLLGVLVHIRTKESDIPSQVVGARLRLSYMLSPAYKVLFRISKDIRLSTALRIMVSTQRTIFNS